MDNAIEALDSSLSPKIRKALIPLLEERPLEEKLSLGRKRFGIDSFTPEKAALALSELLRSEDSTSRVLTLCVLELQKGDGIGLDGKPSLAQGTAQRTPGGDSPGEGFSAVEKALVVRKIPIFHKLRVQEIMAIAEIAQAKSCQAGDVVLREGDMGDALFLVMEGELSVVKREGTAQEIRLDTIRKDECFGEMSLIDQEPRSATIKAETDTLLLQIKGGDFLAIMKKYPRIPLYLCKILCSRLRSLQRMLTPGGTPSHAPFRSGFVLENEVVAHRICGG